MLLFRARRYREAIVESQRVLDLDPNFVNAYWWQGLSYAGNREFSKSIDSLTKATNISGVPLFRALLGHVYGLAGESAKARLILAELTAESSQRFVSPMDFAIVYAGLGDADSTFHWLELAYQARSARMHELSWIYFDRLRNDARYTDLRRRIGRP
jgi:tetratricopeptide (TPR) repeat protein